MERSDRRDSFTLSICHHSDGVISNAREEYEVKVTSVFFGLFG
jgi:hypothetical protein